MRTPCGRLVRAAVTSVAVGVSACSSEPGGPPTDRPDAGPQAGTALVSLSHSAVADGRVAIAVRAQSPFGPVAALQITLHYDPSTVTFEGYQLPRAQGGLITTRLVAPGELRVAALTPAGLPVDAIVLEFTVREAGALSTVRLEDPGTIAATTTGRRLSARIAPGLSEDRALQPGAAVQLARADWATRLAQLSTAAPRPAAFQAGEVVYGDVDFSGAIDLLDALLIADVAVGNHPPLTGDALEVANVVPANVADGVINTLPDPCRPGRECTPGAPYAEVNSGLVDLLDALAVANEAVGTHQPVLGTAVPPPAGTLTGTVTSPTRGALSGVTVTVTPGGAAVTTDATGAYTSPLVLAGSATLSLSDLPSGCTDPGPQAVTVVAEQRTTLDVSVTCPPPAGVTFAQVATGDFHSCGVTAAGAAYCWGINQQGQLGDGTTTERTSPVRVAAPAGVTFTQVATGTYNSCGVTAAGAAYCWGINGQGQLGDGTTAQRTSPVLVAAPAGVTFAQVATGLYHSSGVTAAGAAYCWGYNGYGQLGDGTTTSRATPVRVAAPAA